MAFDREWLLKFNASKRKYPDDGYGLRSRLYNIWRCMHMRCYYPSHKAYPRYGGRGITVCAEWSESYLAFKEWALSSGYSPNLSIDRRENSLGYDPSNCRWISQCDQQRNRRNNRMIEAFGETKTAKEWSRDARCQVSYVSLIKRLDSGRDGQSAITSPGRDMKAATPRLITAFGETKNVAAWASDPRCVVDIATLYWRAAHWIDHAEILTAPSGSRDTTSNLGSYALRRNIGGERDV